MRILIKTLINKSHDEVFKSFDKRLFIALKPPIISLIVSRFDGCETGDEVHLKVGLPFLMQDWISHITKHRSSDEEHMFIDEGHKIPFPLKYWKHTHRVVRIHEGLCEVHDDIEFKTPNILIDAMIYPAMYVQFWLRKPAYRAYFSNKKS